jgi:hypothetical protein
LLARLSQGARPDTKNSISKPIALPLWLLLLLASSVHGITYNCINKNTPSSSCCSGEITLDPTMTTIADSAFLGCSGLNGSLTIPNSVTLIGGVAFRDCSGLTGSLTIPSSVTIIQYGAFHGCSGFNGSLTISSSATSIGSGAFAYCSGFTGSLIIPSSVTGIGTYAFIGCYGFTGSLTIPSSVTDIGEGAFQYCSGFTNAVTFPNSVTTLGTDIFVDNLCNWLSCCDNCTLSGAQMCQCDSSCNGVCQTTFFPTQEPTNKPSFSPSISFAPTTFPSNIPTLLPSISSAPSTFPSCAPSVAPSCVPTSSPTVLVKYGFGVIFGDSGILDQDQAILVSFYKDSETSSSSLPSPDCLFSSHYSLFLRCHDSSLDARQLFPCVLTFRSFSVSQRDVDQVAPNDRVSYRLLGRPDYSSWRPLAVVACESSET